ncbi:MAG: hypothetical protein LIP01_01440, partial [Tannerellaceae bacterium]|nr:hypothetical protein [Tannerellaceae bacterium]
MKEYVKKPQPSSRISCRQTHASRQAPALEVLQRYKNRIQENETGNFSTQGIIQRQPIHGDNFGYDFLGMPILNLLWGEGTPGYQERLNIGNRNGFHLGWQSLMGFNTNNNQFSFNQLRRRTQEPYATTHAGRQIVTRGVSSCSV